MSVAVIVNPVAGGRRSSLPPADRVALVERALQRHQVAGRVELTRAAGHATELARQALNAGCRLVIAWGGDGTVNEVAVPLIHSGAALGIVRAGSGNGLARELGIPVNPDAAIDVALGECSRVVDVGEIDGRPFLNVAGIGFDAAMAVEFNRLGGERRGALRYGFQVARAAFGYEGRRYVIEAAGHRIETEALLIAIANLAQYGSNAVIAPRAKPDDGLLDVVVIGPRGALGRIGLLSRAFDRTIDKANGVTIVPTRAVTISSDQPVAFHTDGEPHAGPCSVTARILPASLVVKACR
jgi:diacylglycerol kinase (ATP)